MRSVIIGAGTYGEVYASYLKEQGVEVVGFLDDDTALQETIVKGFPVLGTSSDLPSMKGKMGIEAVYCPIGNNPLRVKFLQEAMDLGYETPNFIHPTVKIAPDVSIADKGVYILQGSNVMPWATIERFVMISSGANIIHHSHLKEGTFISNGVNLGAMVTAERMAYVGMGATIMTGVKTLGENCLIGAGAVVIKDVPENAVMAGVPAKVLRYKPSATPPRLQSLTHCALRLDIKRKAA